MRGQKRGPHWELNPGPLPVVCSREQPKGRIMLLDHKADGRSSDNLVIMPSACFGSLPNIHKYKKFYKGNSPNLFLFSTTLCPPSRRQPERGRVFHFIDVGEHLCQASLSLATLALFQGHDGFLDSSESYIVPTPIVHSRTKLNLLSNPLPFQIVVQKVAPCGIW